MGMSNEEWHRMQNSKNINEKIKKWLRKKRNNNFRYPYLLRSFNISYDDFSGLYLQSTLIRHPPLEKRSGLPQAGNYHPDPGR